MAGKSLEELNKLYSARNADNSPKRSGMMFSGGPRGGRGAAAHGKPKNTGKTVGRLLSYIGKYKILLVIAALCMLLSTFSSLVGSYMLRPVINSIDDSLYISRINSEKIKTVGAKIIVGDGEAETQKNLPLYIPDVKIEKAGDSFELPVVLNCDEKVNNLKFSVCFDNKLFTVNEALCTDVCSSDDCVINKNEDSVTFIFRENAEIENGTVMILNMTADKDVKDGVYEIAFSDKDTAENVIIALVKILIVLASIYAVGIISSYCQSRLMITVSQNAIETIRNELFSKMQKLPVRLYDRESTGELMSRYTNDVDNIGVMLDNSVVSLFSGVITLVGTLIMMFYTNVWLTLITVVFFPLFMFGSTSIAKASRKYYSAQQAALGAVNGYIEESVSGQKVVKVFNHEEVCIDEFGKLNEYMRSKQFGAQFWGGVMGPIMGNTSQISYALTAGIGGLLCITKGFDVGGLSIFVSYSRHFARPINELSQQTATVFSALAGAERVFALMDSEPENSDVPDAVSGEGMKGYVEFKNVSFGYTPDKTVLHDISLYAKPGQKIAFVGSTGAGKTTVTNLLNRFYDIEEGSITIDGVDIKNYKREDLRRNIAMVLQDTHLFTGTVMENIRYGRLDASDEEVIEAAKTASAHNYITKLSDGYNTMLDGDGANLSQGQRQLINIARAALSKAPILVLDEATSSVDTRTEKLIDEGMSRLMKDRTTFVIAHRLSTVRTANAIMVLENGNIIERGTEQQLLELKGRYYELYTGKRELD